MPRAWAPTPGLEASKVFMAVMKPVPSRPRRFSTGTRQSSKMSSRVTEARIPILSSFFPKLNPGVPFSTTMTLAPRGPLVGVGEGHHRVDLRLSGIGDPLLGAVQDVVIPVPDGRGPNSTGIGAGPGLGDAEGAEAFSRGH